MSALSLKAVRSVAPKKSGTALKRASTGAIHQPCSPPWMTRAGEEEADEQAAS